MLDVVVADELLIEGEEDLVGGEGGGIVLRDVDFMRVLFQRGEVLLDGLVDEDVAVGQVEDFFLHTALEQAVDDLKGGVGFAGAGGHDQQKALLPASDGVEGAVDGDALVVAGGVGVLAGVVRLADGLLLLGGDMLAFFVAANELVGGGEVAHGKLALRAGDEVVLAEA